MFPPPSPNWCRHCSIQFQSVEGGILFVLPNCPSADQELWVFGLPDFLFILALCSHMFPPSTPNLIRPLQYSILVPALKRKHSLFCPIAHQLPESREFWSAGLEIFILALCSHMFPPPSPNWQNHCSMQLHSPPKSGNAYCFAQLPISWWRAVSFWTARLDLFYVSAVLT